MLLVFRYDYSLYNWYDNYCWVYVSFDVVDNKMLSYVLFDIVRFGWIVCWVCIIVGVEKFF